MISKCKMEEENPLEPSTITLPKKCPHSNIRGRPTSAKAVKFTPQPKSIVSRLLRRVREQSCDNINKVNLNGTYDTTTITCSTLNEVNSKNHSTEDEPQLTNAYSIQGSFTLDLTTVDDNHDSFKDSLVDGEQNHIQSNTLPLWDTKFEDETKLLDIPCYMCSHRSSSHQAHRKHLSIHRNQPYACNFPDCNYSCKLSCNLIKHKRIHTSEKPYLCDQCTFRSNFANSLKVHKRIHTAERPYSCQHCGYRCNSSSNLKKHCRHKHRNIP